MRGVLRMQTSHIAGGARWLAVLRSWSGWGLRGMLILGGLLGAAGTCLGQEALTVEGLWAEVQSVSPVLGQRRAEAAAAAARPGQLRTLDDPMLSVELWQVPTSGQQVPLMVGVRQGIPWPSKPFARAQVAEQEARQMKWAVVGETQALKLATTRAYFGYRLASRSLEILRDTSRVLGTIVKAVEIRYRVGRAELAELLSAQADATAFLDQVLDGERQRELAVTEINVLRGKPVDTQLGIPASEPVLRSLPALETLIPLAFSHHPDLLAARATIAQAEAGQRLARLDKAPDLAIWGGYMAMLAGVAEHTFTLGFSTTLPSFSLARAGALQTEATQRRSAAVLALAQREATLQGELRAALLRLDTAARHIDLHGQSLHQTAEHSLRAAQAGYLTGRVPLWLLLSSARMLAIHRLDSERYQAEYAVRWAELEAAVGQPIPAQHPSPHPSGRSSMP